MQPEGPESAAESVHCLQVDPTVARDESPSSDASEHCLFTPLEEGEEYARRILVQQWFRGFSALKAKAEVDRAGLKMLQKHLAESSNSSEEDTEQDEEQQASRMLKSSYKADRMRGELVYNEDTERNELEQEEHNCICILQLLMEESHERVGREEESFAMLKLVHDVMKPDLRWRYIFAWGIMTATSTPPLWRDVDRIACSQRHKPAYMRVPPRTCVVPIEPNPFWQLQSERPPPLALLQMRSEA